ncbi:hypothetical protein N7G274_000299 [Stereocaulon virgatum]|uniref:Fungal N-terminal domain-containing protein n=1 Tax=Stereocaulon virgatum TaxID=373712 RepID=A0ABR4ARR1_9LECA
MDDITVLSVIGAVKATSKTTFSATTLLDAYIQFIAAVDESLRALHCEVNEVRGVLDALEGDLVYLCNTRAKLVRLLPGSFWKVIGDAVWDTQRTVATLGKALRALDPAPKAAMLLKKTVLQIQLDLSADDIAAIRIDIHTHCTNLQLAMVMVRPDNVVNGISPKLSGITIRLEFLKAMVCRLSMPSSLTSNGLLFQGKEPQVECRDSIIDAIHIMLERLTEMVIQLETVHIAETNGKMLKDFQNSDIMDHTRQMMHCARAIITGAGTRPNSSVSDGLLGVTRKARTEQWIYGPGDQEEASGSTDTNSSSIATPQITIAGSIAGGQDDKSDEPESELDEEIDIELVQRMFARGLQEHREAHFGEAVKFLETGIDRATRLSHTRQSSLLIEKLRLHLASSHAEINLRRAFMMIREGYLMESERVS